MSIKEQINRLVLFIFCVLITNVMLGQIRFSENIQPSQSAKHVENSLYFIDFWATWCGPCVYATEYLEVLQKQYSDRFYVVSLSKENPDIVKRFLEKHPTDLAVSIDYKGETFANNNIRALPDGILVNANGVILWRGSPPDFKRSILERFLRQNKKRRAVNKVFKIQHIKEAVVKSDYRPKKDIEIKVLKNKTFEVLHINYSSDYVEYNGSLQDILANQLKVLKSQVKVEANLNKTYQVYVKKSSPFFKNASYEIIDKLNMDLYFSEINGDAIVFEIEQPKFWDTNQIDWGKNTAKYLIDDSRIQADNVTFKDIMYQVASVLKLPVVTTNNSIDNEEHDWQIHYKFYNLMQTDLYDNYGIKVEKRKSKYRVYTITKKTP